MQYENSSSWYLCYADFQDFCLSADCDCSDYFCLPCTFGIQNEAKTIKFEKTVSISSGFLYPQKLLRHLHKSRLAFSMIDVKKIVQKDDPILRQKARVIKKSEIGSPALNSYIEEMKQALASQSDGVAIAGPQMGLGLRIFVVSGRVFSKDFVQNDAVEESEKLPDQVFINPKIVKTSRKKVFMEEGCLSVRYLYGQVKRSEKVTIEALDKNGQKIRRGATGLLAEIFQHEIDHLEGVLFIDKATNIRDLPPNK